MSNYYLIARYKNKNDYEVLKLNDKWFLEEEKATGQEFKANDLEAIDLVTSQFEDKDSFVSRLYQNGYIDDSDVDIFVASKKKKNGKQCICFDEVIYGFENKNKLCFFKTIAENSLNGNMFKDKKLIDKIYDALIVTVYATEDVFNMIINGETNISKRHVEQLSKIPNYENIPYDLKLDKKFKFESYRELRNVFEFFSRLENFGSSKNREDANRSFIEENYDDRLEIEPRLIFKIDGDYCDGQISLFDLDKDNSVSFTGKEKSNLFEDSSLIDIQQYKTKSVAIEKMPQEIFRVLKSIPTNLFTEKNKGWKFNERVFKHPILDEEKDELNSLLTGSMPRYFLDFARHRQAMENANFNGDYFEASELNKSLERDIGAINKRFKKRNCIVDTYRWCRLYEACMKRDAAYAASGINVGSEDVDAKVFGKRQ